MSMEANRNIVRRYFDEVVNTHQYDGVGEFMSENIEFHNSGLHPGMEAFKQWLAMFIGALPDYHATIDDMIAEGDKVVVRITINGTHQGGFSLPEGPNIPATGNPITFPASFIFRLDDGKIAEAWSFSDNLIVMQQLGVIPA